MSEAKGVNEMNNPFYHLDTVGVLALSFAPGVFWLWFFYRRDRLEPEPKSLVIKMFFLGMALVLPAIALERPFSGRTILLLVFAAPVIEEALKFAAVRLTIYRHREFDEPMDGIVYAVAVALGFASLENAYFILTSYLAPQLALEYSNPVWAFGMVWKLYLIRAFLTVPGHALWSALWGYALGLAKMKMVPNGRVAAAKGLALSWVLHGLFNMMLLNFPPGAVGMLVLVPVMWLLVHRRIKAAIAQSPHGEHHTEE
ncbi:MAG TPA: PrsW family glutamic-type intramembrane protease [Spirochaetota bacterium]|nr:PrsW family glutamic-type intramembrane protease [Spirochaetota bacterium]